MYIPNPPAPEIIYFSDGVVDISSGWASFSGRHYRIADVDRIAITRVSTDLAVRWALIYLAVILTVVLTAMMVAPTTTFEGNPELTAQFSFKGYWPFLGVQTPAILYMVCTWLVMAIVAWRHRTSRRIYLLRLEGEFGRVNALASMDQGYIKMVERALQKAMRNEGWA
jgi:hypothetical protein